MPAVAARPHDNSERQRMGRAEVTDTATVITDRFGTSSPILSRFLTEIPRSQAGFASVPEPFALEQDSLSQVYPPRP
jgi:hypothetical protein